MAPDWVKLLKPIDGGCWHCVPAMTQGLLALCGPKVFPCIGPVRSSGTAEAPLASAESVTPTASSWMLNLLTLIVASCLVSSQSARASDVVAISPTGDDSSISSCRSARNDGISGYWIPQRLSGVARLLGFVTGSGLCGASEEYLHPSLRARIDTRGVNDSPRQKAISPQRAGASGQRRRCGSRRPRSQRPRGAAAMPRRSRRRGRSVRHVRSAGEPEAAEDPACGRGTGGASSPRTSARGPSARISRMKGRRKVQSVGQSGATVRVSSKIGSLK